MITLAVASKLTPLSFNLGGVTITPAAVFAPLAFLLFLFLVFRQFYQEEDEERVIEFSLWLSLAFLFFGRIFFLISRFNEIGFSPKEWLSFWSFPGISFSGGVGGSLLWLLWYSYRQHRSFWYWGEKLVGPVLLISILVSLSFFLSNGKIIWLGRIIIFLFLGLLTQPLSRYRSFAWYPSGKVGFLLLSSAALYLLGETGLDFFLQGRLYWQGIVRLGGVVFCLGAIYLLAGVKLKESYWLIRRRRKSEEEKK